jgi:hypothetical protein
MRCTVWRLATQLLSSPHTTFNLVPINLSTLRITVDLLTVEGHLVDEGVDAHQEEDRLHHQVNARINRLLQEMCLSPTSLSQDPRHRRPATRLGFQAPAITVVRRDIGHHIALRPLARLLHQGIR